MKRTLTLLPALLAAASTAFADEHGERLGRVLAHYANDPAIVEKMAKKKAPEDFSDDEMRSVLGLLERYLGDEGLKAQVLARPGAFRHLRLRRLQAYFSLLGVFLKPDQIAEVLKADFSSLRTDDFTHFLTHKALLEPYAAKALPDKLKKAGKQEKILAGLEAAIDADGYPLPEGRAREVVVTVVADVDLLLPPPAPADDAPNANDELKPKDIRKLLLRLRAVGTDADERRTVAERLVEALPALLKRRLEASLAGDLNYEQQRALDRCIAELVD